MPAEFFDMNFVKSLRDSFNESANFMTWAFYALITACAGMVLSQLDEFRTRYSNIVSLCLFFVSMLIFIPNLYFLSDVFRKNIGDGAGFLSFIIGLIMLFINIVPQIYFIVKRLEKEAF